MLSPGLNTICKSCHFIFTACFRDEETEAQRNCNLPQGTQQVSGRAGTYALHSKASAFRHDTSTGEKEGGKQGRRGEGRWEPGGQGQQEGKDEGIRTVPKGVQMTQACLPEEIREHGKGGI